MRLTLKFAIDRAVMQPRPDGRAAAVFYDKSGGVVFSGIFSAAASRQLADTPGIIVVGESSPPAPVSAGAARPRRST
jgi:hypothetical protein